MAEGGGVVATATTFFLGALVRTAYQLNSVKLSERITPPSLVE